MIEEFLENWKKEFLGLAQQSFKKLEEQYSELAAEMIEGLQKRKFVLEGEIQEMEKTLSKKKEEENQLAKDVILMKEAKEKLGFSVREIEGKRDKAADDCFESLQKMEEIKEKENRLSLRERELKEKEMGLKAKEIQLEEKNQRIKAIYDKLNG